MTQKMNVEERISSLTNDPKAAHEVRAEYTKFMDMDITYVGPPVNPVNGLGVDFDGFVTDIRQQLIFFKNPIAMFAIYDNWHERNDVNREILRDILHKSIHLVVPASDPAEDRERGYLSRRYTSSYPYPTWEEFVEENYNGDIEGRMKKMADEFVIGNIRGRYIDFTQDPQYAEQLEALKQEAYEVLLEAKKTAFNRVRRAVLELTEYVENNELWYAFVGSVEKEITQGWMYKLPDQRPRFMEEQFAEARIEKAGEKLVNQIIETLESRGIIRPSEFDTIHVRIGLRSLITAFYLLVRSEYLSHNSQESSQ